MLRKCLFSNLVLIIAILFFFVIFPVSSSTAKTLKLGTIYAEKNLTSQALLKIFKPYVENNSNGSLKIEIFINQQLGSGSEEVEGVKIGTQDLFVGTLTWWNAYVKEIGVATIPFIFDDREHFHNWVDQILEKKLVPELIKNGNQRFVSLGQKWYRGPFRVICARKPIFRPEDINGLKLRMWPSQIIQKSWQGLGANTVTIATAEAYLALKQGIVDAITYPFDTVWARKITEVVKYVTELRQFPQLELMSISEKVWQNLNSEDKKILVEGADKAGQWYNQQAKATLEDAIENKLIKQHNAVYIKVNRQPFVDVFRSKVIPDLVSAGLVEKEWVERVKSSR